MNSDNNNQLTVPDNFGPVADAFKGLPVDNTAWTAGIGMAWPILTLKGKTWGWRFRGEAKIYDGPNPSAGNVIMPVQFLDVVLVKPGSRISKVYYKNGYKDGQREPPECWSADGITPDPGASEKQADMCRGCRHNVFGSRMGDAGQKGKACSDNKRIAVVALNDLQNTDFGGPFMLRLPPGSFSNYTTYVSVMGSRGYHPHTIVTRMMFDPSVAHPRIMFMPVRPLNNNEAAIVIEHLTNPRTDEMLNDKAVAAFADAQDDASTAADLPSGAPTPAAGSAWSQPTQNSGQAASQNPAPAAATKPVDNLEIPPHLQRVAPTPVQTPVATAQALTPAQQKIAELQAQLAAAEAEAAEPEPEPEVLTPEQLKIKELEAKVAEMAKAKARKPRSKPVSPPDATVTPPSNGSAGAGDPPSAVGNAIADRVAKLAGKA